MPVVTHGPDEVLNKWVIHDVVIKVRQQAWKSNLVPALGMRVLRSELKRTDHEINSCGPSWQFGTLLAVGSALGGSGAHL